MKMSKQNKKQIQNAFNDKAIEIEPSKEIFNKIRKNIYEEENKETMKNKVLGFKKGKRLVTIVTLGILLGSITVIGATMGGSWIGHSQMKYRSFPTEEKVLKDVGFSPKYMESLPGGFRYSRGGVGESQLTDDVGNVLTKTKQVVFSYTRGGEESPLTLSVTQIEEQFINIEGLEWVGNVKNLDLYYYEQNYKFVPPNYELTEDDKIAQAKGKLEISFGASEVSIETIQGLSWYEDGLEYMLMGNDYNFAVEEMIEMAKVIIR